MDQEQGSVRGSIPRLSRLPMPRASHDNLRSLSPTRTLRPVASRDALGPANLCTLPRPRALVPTPLGESIGNSIKSRYGWTTSAHDPLSEDTNVQESQVSSANLDTTPPGLKSILPVFDETAENADRDVVVDENATPKPGFQKEKRRPRPSLSERTTETLSQLSPSPSPSRRRSRATSIDSIMGPPSRPASAMKSTRPPTSFTVRAASPTKSLKTPISIANTKKPLLSPSVQSPGPIYTPPKAHVRGRSSHIAKPPKFSSATVTESHHAASHKHTATMSKDLQVAGPKFSKPMKTIDGRTSPVKPPLASIFKDPPKAKPTSSKLDLSSLNTKSTGLMRPKTRGENALASSPTSSPASAKPWAQQVVKKQPPGKQPEGSSSKPLKSSAALREQVAKAKADAMKKKTTSQVPSVLEDVEETSFIVAENKGLLRKRIQGAVTTGSLNISAMGLKQIPDEVMKMYDFDESSTINWSEAVDLVKFLAADNELQELRPDSFPDWSPEDLAADEEKSNQFGGLEILDLHGNQMQEIPVGFRRLDRLQTLNLSKNKLSADAMGVVCQMKNLRELNLANNALSDTLLENIGQLTNLEVLDLSLNQLDALPASISNLTKLKKLNVSGNKFTGLPFELLSNLPLLEILASKNKLGGTLLPNGAKLEQLQVLDVSGNALEAIAFSTNVSMLKLVTLTADSNKLSSLPDVSSMWTLVTLTASGNKLTEFPLGFEQLVAVKNVDFSNNSIKTVPDGIAQMETLATLDLVGNPLRERRYLTMSTDDLKIDMAKRFAPVDSSAEDTTSLATPTTLATNAECSLSTIYTPINGILDLSSKSLASIDLLTINLTTPIHTINLSANNLTHIPVDLLAHHSVQNTLHTLDVSHNPLASTSYLCHPLILPHPQNPQHNLHHPLDTRPPDNPSQSSHASLHEHLLPPTLRAPPLATRLLALRDNPPRNRQLVQQHRRRRRPRPRGIGRAQQRDRSPAA